MHSAGVLLFSLLFVHWSHKP